MGVWNKNRIEVVDSHTGGEPTRVVLSGWPDLGRGPLSERLRHLRSDHDEFRTAVVSEPRGSDHVVGAVLCEPFDPACVAGVIFFNNVGYLGMCVHGTIGVIATLAHLRGIKPGTHRIETPVGVVTAVLEDSGDVSVRNVASYRTLEGVEVDVEAFGRITGDVAWGGNWFFLTSDHHQVLELSNVNQLVHFAWRVRQGLDRQGVRGPKGEAVDHVELFGGPSREGVDSRNFVLCPGKAYDRSPCGTGTSAKLACLHADGLLRPGDVWRQESIVGSVFEGRVEVEDGRVYPILRGSAHVTAEATLLLDDQDPFRMGIRP